MGGARESNTRKRGQSGSASTPAGAVRVFAGSSSQTNSALPRAEPIEAKARHLRQCISPGSGSSDCVSYSTGCEICVMACASIHCCDQSSNRANDIRAKTRRYRTGQSNKCATELQKRDYIENTGYQTVRLHKKRHYRKTPRPLQFMRAFRREVCLQRLSLLHPCRQPTHYLPVL